jgi:hypothetical protein
LLSDFEVSGKGVFRWSGESVSLYQIGAFKGFFELLFLGRSLLYRFVVRELIGIDFLLFFFPFDLFNAALPFESEKVHQIANKPDD